jgi:hypothetical protein
MALYTFAVRVIYLVGVLPEEFWAYTLDTIDGVAMRLNESSDILKTTPAVTQDRLLFIQPSIICILYDYCTTKVCLCINIKLLSNRNMLVKKCILMDIKW